MPPLPQKKAVALDLLERTSLFVHLDPRRPGVIVPLVFGKQPQLVLQIGLNMAIAIPDLEVNDTGISCTLSFNRRPHLCRLPWSAIYALIGQEGGGMVWPEDVPPEVVAQQRSASKKEPPRKPALRAVDGGDSADRNGSEDEAPPAQRSAALAAARETAQKQALRRPTTPPPRLVQQRSVQPGSVQPGSAQPEAEAAPAPDLAASHDPGSSQPELRDLTVRPSSEPSRPAASKSRPPYLRLVR
ncbi:MAG TPA: ClpXP protease specificity-enhancing factor SspB [Polyangiaceae bacterium]|nr:ClpXP protease specificity-enhancing factor SspB [Polyangiaceae bacterium]